MWVDIPIVYKCPSTGDVLHEPVALYDVDKSVSYFERSFITEKYDQQYALWLAEHGNPDSPHYQKPFVFYHPITGSPLRITDKAFAIDDEKKRQINDYLQANNILTQAQFWKCLEKNDPDSFTGLNRTDIHFYLISKNEQGTKPLFWCIQNGKAKSLEQLLMMMVQDIKSCDFNIKSIELYEYLWEAVENNKPHCFYVIVRYFQALTGSACKVPLYKDKETWFSKAIEKNCDAMAVELLKFWKKNCFLNREAEIHAWDVVLKKGKWQFIFALYKMDVTPDYENEKQMLDYFMWFAHHSKDDKWFQRLLQDKNKIPQKIWFLIWMHIREDDNLVGLTNLLIQNGIKVEEPGNQQSALIQAVKYKRYDSVELFCNKGANLEEVDEKGHNALRWAADLGDVQIFFLLLSKGACLTDETMEIFNKKTKIPDEEDRFFPKKRKRSGPETVANQADKKSDEADELETDFIKAIRFGY